MASNEGRCEGVVQDGREIFDGRVGVLWPYAVKVLRAVQSLVINKGHVPPSLSRPSDSINEHFLVSPIVVRTPSQASFPDVQIHRSWRLVSHKFSLLRAPVSFLVAGSRSIRTSLVFGDECTAIRSLYGCLRDSSVARACSRYFQTSTSGGIAKLAAASSWVFCSVVLSRDSEPDERRFPVRLLQRFVRHRNYAGPR